MDGVLHVWPEIVAVLTVWVLTARALAGARAQLAAIAAESAGSP